MQTEEVKEAARAPEPATPSRRRLPIVPILVLVAIVGGLIWLILARSSPAQQVRRLIDKQIKLANGGRFDQLWQDTLSVTVKKECPKDSFTGAMDQLRSSRPEFWNLIEYRDLHVEVNGDRAMVTYVIVYNGAPVERATPGNPDLYVRAPKTIYGPTLSVAQQLENLDHLRAQRLVIGKEYDKERAAIIAHGPIKVVESIKGQWYDDADGHVRCG